MSDNLTAELEQSKYKPPYDARPMRMLRHHIECDCLASRRGVLREIEDLFAIELTKRDEQIAELEQAIAATLGSEPPYDELLRCLVNDWHISASWDGLRKFWCIELTEEGVRLRDGEPNSRAAHDTLTAEQVREAIFHGSVYASYDGVRYYADGIRMQAIADELNAMIGGEDKSQWAELFGTPERAAQTLHRFCADCFGGDCATCGVPEWADYTRDYDALLEWLRGDAE